MRTGVIEILTLQINLRAAEFVSQASGKCERRRTARVILEKGIELVLKLAVVAGGEERGRLFVERCDERLGNKSSAVVAPVSAFVWFEIHTAFLAFRINSSSFL